MAHFIKDKVLNKKSLFSLVAVLVVAFLFVVLAISVQQFAFILVPAIILVGIIFLIFLFREPLIGLFVFVSYSFLFVVFSREIGGPIPYGMGHELFLVLLWLSIWYNADRYDFSRLKNNFIWLTLIWFGLSVIQIVNPYGSNPMAWLQEMRTIALYPLGVSCAGVLLLNTRKRINYFLCLILFLSLLASLNGIKQITIGLSAGEQYFLYTGGYVTHLIFGKLRVFSFMNDAGQFGASQAQFVVIALVLAIGLKGKWKKIILFILVGISFYGMLISGTRGALFALLAGLLVAILLSKNYKVFIIGGTAAALFFGMLKFTYIGNTNYHIYRLRTGVDSKDPSFNLRLVNQQKLSEFMKTKPFGTGLGTIGFWAEQYNPGRYLTTIAPDSYWVKVWVMYGISGLIFFFGMWMFIFGKLGAMLWNMKDKILRTKLIALISGAFGIFLCSYGNEVMNTMPSLTVFQLSIGAVFMMCIVYKEEEKSKNTIIKVL